MPAFVRTGTGLEGVASLKKNLLSDQTEARVAHGLAWATGARGWAPPLCAQSAAATGAEDKRGDEGAAVLLLPPESGLWRQVQEAALREDAGAVPRGSRGGGVRDEDEAQGALLMVWLKTQ
jgi:hypothetical protein